ncbi:MAG: hypothetical protein IAI50_21035, partial [Candidatus Eremiobacteraeota bacterium]|nr:hypothetical protein [Candidatus Eremiobacteraeota bacterium]
MTVRDLSSSFAERYRAGGSTNAMRRAALALFLVFAARPALASERTATIARTFAQARAHDANAISAARAAAHGRGDRSFDDVYGLALYVVDPKRYRRDFVDAYPTTTAGVMSDYAGTIGAGHLLASPVYPFRALGDIAASGHTRAFDRLYRAYAVSDGFAAESLAGAIGAAARAQPANALAALAALPPMLRERLAGDGGLWSDGGTAAAIARPRPNAPAAADALRTR